MDSRLYKILIVLISIIIGGLIGGVIGWTSPKPISRDYVIKARKYAYEPKVIKVNKGDTLNIKLVSLDVVHGFYVEGYDVDAKIYSNKKKFFFKHPSKNGPWEEVDKITIITNKTGKYRFRCSNTCGTMHPFMQGELIVNPNTTYHAGIGSVVGLFLGMIWMYSRKLKVSSNTHSFNDEVNVE